MKARYECCRRGEPRKKSIIERAEDWGEEEASSNVAVDEKRGRMRPRVLLGIRAEEEIHWMQRTQAAAAEMNAAAAWACCDYDKPAL